MVDHSLKINSVLVGNLTECFVHILSATGRDVLLALAQHFQACGKLIITKRASWIFAWFDGKGFDERRYIRISRCNCLGGELLIFVVGNLNLHISILPDGWIKSKSIPISPAMHRIAASCFPDL